MATEARQITRQNELSKIAHIGGEGGDGGRYEESVTLHSGSEIYQDILIAFVNIVDIILGAKCYVSSPLPRRPD